MGRILDINENELEPITGFKFIDEDSDTICAEIDPEDETIISITRSRPHGSVSEEVRFYKRDIDKLVIILKRLKNLK